MSGTRWAWCAAYERRASNRVDWAMSELEAFAADGEADALRYELPAAQAALQPCHSVSV